jgi:hypothetical protein
MRSIAGCGRDLADWLDRLNVNANVATVMCSFPASRKSEEVIAPRLVPLHSSVGPRGLHSAHVLLPGLVREDSTLHIRVQRI